MRRSLAACGFLLLAVGPFARNKPQRPRFSTTFTRCSTRQPSRLSLRTTLRQRFAPSTVHTTARTDMTYAGLYFFGDHTYIELFDVANTPVSGLGSFGIGFGVEQSGAVAALAAANKGSLSPPMAIKKTYDGRQIPWFTLIAPATEKDGAPFSLWLMEYDPEYLRQWEPQNGDCKLLANCPADITRAGALRRARTTLSPVDRPVFADIFEATFALDDTGRAELLTFAHQLGLRESHSGTAITLRGEDFTLIVVPAGPGPNGLRRLRMHTAPGTAPQPDRTLRQRHPALHTRRSGLDMELAQR